MNAHTPWLWALLAGCPQLPSDGVSDTPDPTADTDSVDPTPADTATQEDTDLSADTADTDLPADTDLAADTDPEPSPLDTRTNDTVAVVDSTPVAPDTAPSAADTDQPPVETAPPPVETAPGDDSGATGPGDTTRVDSSVYTDSSSAPDETAAPVHTDAPTWPVTPRCTFRNDGVHIPMTGFRSIDFDYAAGAGLTVVGNHLPVNDGDQVHELLVHVGPVSRRDAVFLRAPPQGDTFYTNLIVGAVRRDATRVNQSVARHRQVDLDADGGSDYVTRVETTTTTECLAWRADPGERSMSSYDWRFIDSTTGGAPMLCDVVDFDGDGQDDLNLHFVRPDGTAVVRWYPGPFLRGEVDLAGRSVAEIELATLTELSFDAYGDFNHDGVQDMAQAWYGADRRGGEVLIWFGPVSGALAPEAPDLRIESTSESELFVLYQPELLGDIDGDGIDDLAISASGHDFNGVVQSGAVFVFKGPLLPGPPLRDTDADAIITWPTAFARTGHTLVPLGDVDGDERDDFAVGVWGDAHRMPAGFDHNVLWPSAQPALHALQATTDTALDTWGDSADTGTAWPYPYPAPPPGFPYYSAEGAVMVFGDVPAGVIGPAEAMFTLMGAEDDYIGGWGVTGPGDLNGDGLADLAFSGDPYGVGVHVFVVYPCTDFGTPLAAP